MSTQASWEQRLWEWIGLINVVHKYDYAASALVAKTWPDPPTPGSSAPVDRKAQRLRAADAVVRHLPGILAAGPLDSIYASDRRLTVEKLNELTASVHRHVELSSDEAVADLRTIIRRFVVQEGELSGVLVEPPQYPYFL